MAYLSLGRLLLLTDVDQALRALEHAKSIDPGNAGALARLYFQRLQICDWSDIDSFERDLLALVRAGKTGVSPFCLLPMETSSPSDHLIAARAWGSAFEVPAHEQFTHLENSRSASTRLRLGYLSSDFHDHATAYLAVELLESHDRSNFELFAYSCGPDDNKPMRHRLVAAFDHFRDIVELSDRDAADLIKRDGIDILVDLKGYTGGARTRILAYRPAPIQIAFLGYPGSMGARFIDAVIADCVVLPIGDDSDYDEEIIRLPGCYQPNDSRREIAEKGPDRASCGLPTDEIVFCSFNNSYKITPALFAIWMRLLDSVPGSVLWLLDTNDRAKANLRAQADSLGVEPERLVFAPWLGAPDHLRRLGLADLFLDTLPYNAHTTASDALRTGVPIVTCTGDRFAGRVAASLLEAAGLPELVTRSLEEYESLALALARDPSRLTDLRIKLKRRRTESDIFDGAHFAMKLEDAYRALWARRRNF